jgi:hypothetical protein
MYTITHVDKSWTVQGKLFIFDRKSLALKTVHVLHGDEASKRKSTTVCSEGGRDYRMI